MQHRALNLRKNAIIRIRLILLLLTCFLLVIVISFLYYQNFLNAYQGFLLITLGNFFMLTVLSYHYVFHGQKKGAETHMQSKHQELSDHDSQNPPVSEHRFRQLTDSITDSFCTLDRNLIYTYWNKASEKLTGLRSEEVVGRHLLEVFPESASNQFLQCAESVMQNGKPDSFKTTQTIEGKKLHFEIKVYPDEEGIAILCTDISQLTEIKTNLQQEKERLELILRGVGLGTWDWYIPTDKITYNEQWINNLGFQEEELQGNSNVWKERVHPDDLLRMSKNINDHLAGNTAVYRLEHQMKTKEGKWIWVLEIGKVVERDKHGNAIRMVGISINIQPTKELEARLNEQKLHLELVMRNANLGTWDWYIKEDKWVRDEHWYHMLGYEPGELAEETEVWTQITYLEDIPMVKEALYNHLEGKTDSFRCEHRVLHKDGRCLWMLGGGIVIERDEDGKPLRMIGMLQDITFLKEKEKELNQQKERLELTIQGADLGMWDWHGPDGKVNVNDRWASMLGYSKEEIEPHVKSWSTLVHPDDFPKVMEILQPHLDGKTGHYQTEYRMKTKEGDWKWILDRGKAVEHDEQGRATRMMGVHLDIDASKRMQEELRTQKERLELILWAADLGTWDLDLLGPNAAENVSINERCATMLGYTKEEFTHFINSGEWQNLYHPDDKEASLTLLNKHLAGETSYFRSTHRNITKDGEWKWILNTGKVVERDESGMPKRFSGIQQDISELKEAESSMYFYKKLVEYGHDPAYGIDPNDEAKITYVNDAACRHFGMSKEELIGKSIYEVSLAHERYSQPELNDIIREKQSFTFEVIHRIKGGELVPVEVTANHIVYDGREYFAGYFKNIKKRKDAEAKIKKVNVQLEQRVKERTAELEATNQELEAFSYSVSHDLRAPLRSIDGFSKALLEDYYEILDEEGQDFLQCIRDATSNMGTLIDDMLKLSKVSRTDLKREKLDISLIVSDILSKLKKENPKREISTEVTSGLMAEADRKLISIALQNLLENAWKFTQGKENPHIIFSAKREDGQKVFCIQDNGAGFDMKYAHKLFGAFQRLHHTSEFEGTGVGLATVQRIIHRHGGKIWAEAEIDKGAAFYFTLT